MLAPEYSAIKKLIYSIAWKFVRRWGGDFEEVVAEANLVYARIRDQYDPEKASFSNFLHTSINNHLMDMQAYENRRRCLSINRTMNGHSGETWAAQIPANSYKEFDRSEFERDLSFDAKQVLQLILEAPGDIEQAVRAKGNQPRNWRSTVRSYLQDLGWAAVRVSRAFDEIRGAL